jgi:hypothetical protein
MPYRSAAMNIKYVLAVPAVKVLEQKAVLRRRILVRFNQIIQIIISRNEIIRL